MFKFVAAAILLSVSVCADAYMLLPIDEVYDGDTIKTHISEGRLPPPLNEFSIRIRGIDTPEMPAKSYNETGKLGRAGCIQEAELALEARAFVEWIATGYTKMKVDNFEWGKFGGRVIGDVSINGVDVAESLIGAKLAVPYFGDKKTMDWCAFPLVFPASP